MTNSLWNEKYRPKTIADYVGNEELVSNIKHWIDTNDVPNLLLHSSSPGTGKTTAAKLIANSLDADVMYINASSENGIEVIRQKITAFVENVGFSRWKIVILDEADFISVNGMAALRSVMEEYTKNSRFILTCNYVERIIEPIQSRCVAFHVNPPSKAAVAKRMVHILNGEGIRFDPINLKKIVDQFYPDQRRIINSLQTYSRTGELTVPSDTLLVADYASKILAELKSIKDVKTAYANIRQIIADSKVRQFDDLYKLLYDNIDCFPDGKRAMIILQLADFSYKSAFVVDKEINTMAMIINILQILK